MGTARAGRRHAEGGRIDEMTLVCPTTILTAPDSSLTQKTHYAHRNFRLSRPLHLAMGTAVAEIDGHSDDQPHKQPYPGHLGETQHHSQGNQYAENGYQRNQRRLERTLQRGTSPAQNPNPR